MGQQIELPPGAANLSASMRDIGYSLDTAVADLIDNSISAGASLVQVFYREHEGLIAVIDNGCGMDQKSLTQAMKFGSSLKGIDRKTTDLGKFGLGLKTATFSQCRMLTVVSRQDGRTVGATQDLDEIDKTDKWLLNIHDISEIKSIPLLKYLPENGTMVLWRKLDRLGGKSSKAKNSKVIDAEIAALEQHLGLVFHRFLDGEAIAKKLHIEINGKSVEHFDPFCRNHQATQYFVPEYIQIGSSKVKITPFVLPHYKKLTKAEFSFYNKISNFYDNQGIYVYRNKRLLIWGTWLSAASRSEITKLARIQVDFSSDQDDYWVIDIKKSKAKPHEDVREVLKKLLPGVLEASSRIFRPGGQVISPAANNKNDLAPVWERRAASGTVFFDLNRNHLLLQKIIANMTDSDKRLFKFYLDSIVKFLPVELIYSEFSSNPNDMKPESEPDSTVMEQMKEFYKVMCIDNKRSWDEYVSVVKIVPAFATRTDLLNKISKEVNNA